MTDAAMEGFSDVGHIVHHLIFDPLSFWEQLQIVLCLLVVLLPLWGVTVLMDKRTDGR